MKENQITSGEDFFSHTELIPAYSVDYDQLVWDRPNTYQA